MAESDSNKNKNKQQNKPKTKPKAQGAKRLEERMAEELEAQQKASSESATVARSAEQTAESASKAVARKPGVLSRIRGTLRRAARGRFLRYGGGALATAFEGLNFAKNYTDAEIAYLSGLTQGQRRATARERDLARSAALKTAAIKSIPGVVATGAILTGIMPGGLLGLGALGAGTFWAQGKAEEYAEQYQKNKLREMRSQLQGMYQQRTRSLRERSRRGTGFRPRAPQRSSSTIGYLD